MSLVAASSTVVRRGPPQAFALQRAGEILVPKIEIRREVAAVVLACWRLVDTQLRTIDLATLEKNEPLKRRFGLAQGGDQVLQHRRVPRLRCRVATRSYRRTAGD